MEKFVGGGSHFAFTDEVKWPVRVVALSEVQPPERSAGVEWFVRGRMVDVLRKIAAGEAMYPVEVHESTKADVRYRVRDGFHRYYASVAAGFTHLPVEVRPYFEFETPTIGKSPQ